jgi:phage shock protein A
LVTFLRDNMPSTADEQLVAARQELAEFRATSAEIEHELQAALEDKEREAKALAARLADAEAKAKKLTLETNDLRAELDEERQKAKAQRSKLEDAVNDSRKQAAELSRVDRLLRQRDFDLEKLQRECDGALETAILAETTTEDLRARVRELEGKLMHVTEERDTAVIAATSAPQADEQVPGADGGATSGRRRRASLIAALTPRDESFVSSTVATSPGSTAEGAGAVAKTASSSAADALVVSSDLREVLELLRTVALECRETRVKLTSRRA